MLYIIGPLFTILLLFTLCRAEERAMEFERDFWIQNHQAMTEMQWGWSY
ncbi:MAG: hypothetical protein HYR70_13345 [Chloroflexi bacterium]|nr:hypothetical protein [Chloroflexota bacterium]MBI1856388.1 hypothetical protein [Chloroflexota bacterium]MBI3339616.1 hypothetical protein [Chloroflexota bacterium]